jgi:hypothetical protein
LLWFSLNLNQGNLMTRIKEPDADASEVPDYKSPPSRIIRSLRKAYDNLRGKLKEKARVIQDLTGKLRDTQESRDHWKVLAKAAEDKIALQEEENLKLRENLKKKQSK